MIEPQALSQAVRALARASRIVERASLDLSFADYRVMSAIEGGEGRASRLADRLALGKPAVSASVESLSKRGLVIRSKVDGDNRAIALSLSEEGRELYDRMQGRMSRQLELLAERTPDPAGVIRALGLLDDAVEAAIEQRYSERLAEEMSTAETAQ
jgi:DNA-binding MarR family transcriptional regulator